jgi:TetR/AcrR family transcriptional repressor of mexJK operon
VKDSPKTGAKAPPRRPGRPSLSNAELLDKAFVLFRDQGFERTSLDAITAAAGMAKRTVYQRYGDKETLFKEALKRTIENFLVPAKVLRAAETEDLEETLLAIGRLLLDNLMTPTGIGLLRITNSESGRMPEIGGYTYTLGTDRTIDYLAELLRRRLGTVDDGDDARWQAAGTAFLYLVVSGPPTMTAWGMTLSDAQIDDHMRFNVHLFLHGLMGTQPVAPGTDAEAVQIENGRLRSLLIASVLEAAELRERLAAMQ